MASKFTIVAVVLAMAVFSAVADEPAYENLDLL
jgi:hypothetical protein